jgi:hypothetical protein
MNARRLCTITKWTAVVVSVVLAGVICNGALDWWQKRDLYAYTVGWDDRLTYGVLAIGPFVVVAAVALLLWGHERKERRSMTWLCAKCGYDRRGLATVAECPECGTVPTK